MQLVTIGPKYQIVIPKEVRKKLKSFKPGNKVSVSTQSGKINVDPTPQSWVERNAGLMKKAWENIDTTKYLERLRDEWERKY